MPVQLPGPTVEVESLWPYTQPPSVLIFSLIGYCTDEIASAWIQNFHFSLFSISFLGVWPAIVLMNFRCRKRVSPAIVRWAAIYLLTYLYVVIYSLQNRRLFYAPRIFFSYIFHCTLMNSKFNRTNSSCAGLGSHR